MDGTNMSSFMTDQEKKEKILRSIKKYREESIRFNRTPYLEFSKIRYFFASDLGLKNKLDGGRLTLENIDHCIQYWFTYCNTIIPEPWKLLHKKYHDLRMYQQKIEIFDYAAGQGQATICLLDRFYNREDYFSNRTEYISRNNVKKISLIDLSTFATSLGKEILNIHSPEIGLDNIHVIQKDIDSLDINDLSPMPDTYKIHLFSYILDMGKINAKKLIEKILSIKGKHFIWATSQQGDRDWNKDETGQYHFDNFYKELDRQINYSQNVIKKSQRYQTDLLIDKFSTTEKDLPCAIFGRYIEVK